MRASVFPHCIFIYERSAHGHTGTIVRENYIASCLLVTFCWETVQFSDQLRCQDNIIRLSTDFLQGIIYQQRQLPFLTER